MRFAILTAWMYNPMSDPEANGGEKMEWEGLGLGLITLHADVILN